MKNYIINKNHLPSFVQVIYDPQNTFRRLKINSSWLPAFIVYCFGLIFVGYLMLFVLFQIHSTVTRETFNFSTISYFFNKWILISLLFIPFFELVKLFILSFFSLGLCWIFNVFQIHFKELFSFICHARIIFMLEAFFNMSIILTLGPQN